MKKILVIGERCTDAFIYGESKRLSPEAPVPVFTPIQRTVNDGMAGNVVANLKALTSEYEIEFVHQKELITKTRYVDYKSNHMFLRVDEGENQIEPLPFTKELEQQLINADVVVVSDYDKGFLNEHMLLLIGSYSKFCVLDTKKSIQAGTIRSYNYVKWNESEYNNNSTVDSKDLGRIIVTLGSKGALYMGTLHPSPSPKETIDVSGAGDTFLSAFLVKYLEIKDVNASIVFANKIASAVVSKRGVALP